MLACFIHRERIPFFLFSLFFFITSSYNRHSLDFGKNMRMFRLLNGASVPFSTVVQTTLMRAEKFEISLRFFYYVITDSINLKIIDKTRKRKKSIFQVKFISCHHVRISTDETLG